MEKFWGGREGGRKEGKKGEREGGEMCPLLFLEELCIGIDTYIWKQKSSVNELLGSVVLHIIEIKVY